MASATVGRIVFQFLEATVDLLKLRLLSPLVERFAGLRPARPRATFVAVIVACGPHRGSGSCRATVRVEDVARELRRSDALLSFRGGEQGGFFLAAGMEKVRLNPSRCKYSVMICIMVRDVVHLCRRALNKNNRGRSD